MTYYSGALKKDKNETAYNAKVTIKKRLNSEILVHNCQQDQRNNQQLMQKNGMDKESNHLLRHPLKEPKTTEQMHDH